MKTLIAGTAAALAVYAVFRGYGALFFVEGRMAGMLHAAGGGALGFGLGNGIARMAGLRAVMIGLVPGLLIMAVVTSHFGVLLPNMDPRLDKGFGGFMLWLAAFIQLGALFQSRAPNASIPDNGETP